MLHNNVRLLQKTVSSFPEKMVNWVSSPHNFWVLFDDFCWEDEVKTILQHKYFLAEPVSCCCNVVFLYGSCTFPLHLGYGLRSTLFSCKQEHPSGAVQSILWGFPSSHQDPQINQLSAGVSEREIKQWPQEQGCEKAEVKSLTSSAVMEQGPGFVNQELTAALGHHNHTETLAPSVLLSVCYYFIQFKC